MEQEETAGWMQFTSSQKEGAEKRKEHSQEKLVIVRCSKIWKICSTIWISVTTVVGDPVFLYTFSQLHRKLLRDWFCHLSADPSFPPGTLESQMKTHLQSLPKTETTWNVFYMTILQVVTKTKGWVIPSQQHWVAKNVSSACLSVTYTFIVFSVHHKASALWEPVWITSQHRDEDEREFGACLVSRWACQACKNAEG